MNLPTLIVAMMILAVFVAIMAVAVRNRKNGKSACACGGDCRSCGHCKH